MISINERVAAVIKDARRERKLSQGQLADRVGSTRGSISNIERGTQSLSLDLFIRIASALSVYPHDLLKEALQSQKQSNKNDLHEVEDPLIRDLIEKAIS